MLPIQISTFFEVIPSWLPPVAITVGFGLLLVGFTQEILYGYLGHWKEYNPHVMLVISFLLTVSIGGALYTTIQRQDYTLLFTLIIFFSGRIIQGAVSTLIIKKVLDKIILSSSNSEGIVSAIGNHVVSSLKKRVILIVVSTSIVAYTSASIASVFILGSGNILEAFERFWFGFFFLTLSGLAYDFRNFAHKISWTAAIGLMVAISGAFLYSPVGFSKFTPFLSPYLQNPIPSLLRLPFGVIGGFFGVTIWAIFYVKSMDRRNTNQKFNRYKR